MSVPLRCATCQIVSPSLASTSLPSRLNVMVLLIASPLAERLYEIVAEILEHAAQRVRCGLAEAADRGIAHRGGKLVQQRLVPRPGCHQLDGLLGSDTAWRALAAALVLEEAHQVQRHGFHVVLVGED